MVVVGGIVDAVIIVIEVKLVVGEFVIHILCIDVIIVQSNSSKFEVLGEIRSYALKDVLLNSS